MNRRGLPDRRLDKPDRLIALTDGVFAISMTLLALDVRVPDDVAADGFGPAAEDFYATYIIFMVAFAITARFWLESQATLTRLEAVDREVQVRTLFFLGGISSLPAATRLLIRFISAPLAMSSAAVMLSITSLLSARLWWYVSAPDNRLANVSSADRIERLWDLLWNAGVFLLAVPAAYLLAHLGLNPARALFAWLLLLLDSQFVWLVGKVRERRGKSRT